MNNKFKFKIIKQALAIIGFEDKSIVKYADKIK